MYHGLDWRKLTPSAFLSRLKHADYVVKNLNGSWSERDALQKKTEEDNRKISLMLKYRGIFKDYSEIKTNG